LDGFPWKAFQTKSSLKVIGDHMVYRRSIVTMNVTDA